MFALSASLALSASAVLVLGGCSKRVEEPISESRLVPSPAPLVTSASAAAPNEQPPVTEATPLLTLPSSAYQASIFVDGDGVELLTASAAYHLVPGKEPLRRAIDLGFGATVTRQHYVYWSNGTLWSEPRRAQGASAPKQLQRLAHPPQRIAADITGAAIAWLEHAEDGRDSLQTLGKPAPKTLYTSPGSIDALTLIGQSVYFVERPEGDRWRIGSVKLTGAAPSFTASKAGRWPAMLSGTKELVYYDGNGHDLLALSLDLKQERTVAKGFICSPLSAALNVYCATMSGVFEVTGTARPRQLVASSNVVASLSADARRLAFIVDTGSRDQDQLTVKTLAVGAAAAP